MLRSLGDSFCRKGTEATGERRIKIVTKVGHRLFGPKIVQHPSVVSWFGYLVLPVGVFVLDATPPTEVDTGSGLRHFGLFVDLDCRKILACLVYIYIYRGI